MKCAKLVSLMNVLSAIPLSVFIANCELTRHVWLLCETVGEPAILGQARTNRGEAGKKSEATAYFLVQ